MGAAQTARSVKVALAEIAEINDDFSRNAAMYRLADGAIPQLDLPATERGAIAERLGVAFSIAEIDQVPEMGLTYTGEDYDAAFGPDRRELL